MMVIAMAVLMNIHPTYCLYHHDHHPHVIARYKETIVTIANREQEADRTVIAIGEYYGVHQLVMIVIFSIYTMHEYG